MVSSGSVSGLARTGQGTYTNLWSHHTARRPPFSRDVALRAEASALCGFQWNA